MTKIKIKMNHVIQYIDTMAKVYDLIKSNLIYIDTPPHLLARGGGNDSLLCEPRHSSD